MRLPRRLLVDYGSGPNSPQQVARALERARLEARYRAYALALFCEDCSLTDPALGQHDWSSLRQEALALAPPGGIPGWDNGGISPLAMSADQRDISSW